MKRFITVLSKHGEEVLIILRDSAAVAAGGAAGADAYKWVKQKLQAKQINHHDQQATSHTKLPQQDGYMSFYTDEDGTWMKVSH